jgi:hypothetical protein
MKAKFLSMAALVALSLGVVSCSDNNDDLEVKSAKESALEAAIDPYVDNTVLPVYAEMADKAILLSDLCETMQTKHAAGTLTSADVKAAGEAWKASRKAWERSEAFLFGPAAQHNIDPHIDSWPLDKAAMDDLLTDIRNGKKLDIANNFNYGLLGFHSVEYLLFELDASEQNSLVHSLNYTAEELTYLVTVANDLRDQCVLLEACWAGMDNISEAKKKILEDAELDYGEEYGWEMKNAGKAGSRFKSYQDAAEEVLQGCIDIADEVGNVKIGRPNSASSEEDKNYIESPYSLNSIEDFEDNIISIENSYIGTRSGDKSISDYVKSKDAELDKRLRQAITDSRAAIRAIPEPFAKNATCDAADKAVKMVGTDLVDVLTEVYNLLGKY